MMSLSRLQDDPFDRYDSLQALPRFKQCLAKVDVDTVGPGMHRQARSRR